ncbi:MAG TPA: ABC transporter substrate-binding protein [Anaerolineales bacterium]
MSSLLRRVLPTGLIVALLVLTWAAPAWTKTTLKVIPQASLRVLDPIWTTAYLTRNHGYLVYDTLFALDANFKVQPQMVDTWTMTDNGLTYTFTLRPGLKFHDGAPVTSRDVIASIKRWGARDLFGQKLMSYTQSMDAVSEATFTPAKETELLPSPRLRTGRESFPSSGSSME